MTTLKFKRQEQMTRTEVADRLTQIAKALRDGAKLKQENDGEKLEFDLNVPDEVSLEFEVEFEDGKTELELEIKWMSATDLTASTGPAA